MATAIEQVGARSSRPRPRLSRTFSRGRWREYREFLRTAIDHDYRIVSLESWIIDGYPEEDRMLLLRHDVDQHPRSALAMASIEAELGLRSSWYFRWRTAHPIVIGKLRRSGFEVGLHYETLTRNALEQGLTGPADQAQIENGRAELRAEITAFARAFGPTRSAVPHGDSRIPAVHNAELLRDENCPDYGIAFDGNEAMRGHELGFWLTDRTSAEGGWRDGVDPADLLAAGTSPILSLTHPNNWASGPGLWLDRLLGAALASKWPSRPIRTGGDQPPL